MKIEIINDHGYRVFKIKNIKSGKLLKRYYEDDPDLYNIFWADEINDLLKTKYRDGYREILSGRTKFKINKFNLLQFGFFTLDFLDN